jgi:hypothetical protein
MYTDGKPVFISPKKGNRLWRVDLQPATPQKITAAGTVNKIIVKGKLGNNRFTQTITAETRLNGPEYN